jgi:uncharacterized protein YdeI (YjbR/CyaY-like superfamily)
MIPTLCKIAMMIIRSMMVFYPPRSTGDIGERIILEMERLQPLGASKMSGMNPKVDGFIQRADQWKEEFIKLRAIVLDCGLTEELKWGVPCYTVNDKNVVLIHGFKEYCAILFVKGALLKDTHGILITQTENVQAARHMRFTGVREIEEVESILKAYIFEAAEAEKDGRKVQYKGTAEFSFPDELQHKMEENPELRTAFEALTPGRQRAYLLYFSQPKQVKTREARIEKCMPQILEGKGLND